MLITFNESAKVICFYYTTKHYLCFFNHVRRLAVSGRHVPDACPAVCCRNLWQLLGIKNMLVLAQHIRFGR